MAKIYDGTHQTPKYVEKGVPFYSVEHITSNNFKKTKYISEEVFEKECKRVKIEKGDILMTRIGDIGTSKYIDWNVNASFYVSVALIKSIKNLDSEYLNQFISSLFFQKELWKRTIHVAFPRKINLGEIGLCQIYFPKLKEQTKIAKFLSKLDERITRQREIITHLETLIKGYRQKLFSQELRFKDENGNDFPDWVERKLKNYLIQKSIRNKNLNVVSILSVSNSKGFILQSEQFDNHRVASKDISNYKIVEENDFAYNPSRINVGSIAKLIGFKQGVVSPMYIVFSLNKTISSLFFENLINTHLFKHLVKVGCSGSVRDSLNYEELENFKFKMPSLKEQEKIANFLSKLDKKLTTEKELLIELEEQKKFFLQNMFV